MQQMYEMKVDCLTQGDLNKGKTVEGMRECRKRNLVEKSAEAIVVADTSCHRQAEASLSNEGLNVKKCALKMERLCSLKKQRTLTARGSWQG